MIDIRNCVFGFKCSADWDAMKATSNATIRHCSGCKKDVYQVSTKEEFLEAIQLNRCVAIFDSPMPGPTLGVPARYKSNDKVDFKKLNIDEYDIPAFLRNPDDKK